LTYAHIINDIVKRALDAVKIPAIWNPQASIGQMASILIEPPLFLGGVGKCWCGMPLARYTVAPLYTSLATGEAEAVANEAKKKTKATYAHLEASHHFVPIAVESESGWHDSSCRTSVTT